MKRYSVWIEVEEYDDKTDLYSHVEGLEFPATATFKTEEEAISFATVLNKVGDCVSQLDRMAENLKFEREWERKHHHANKKR